jgi:hydrogenase maturation protease
MTKKLMILGYGNPDRGDDGVAYWLLNQLILSYKDVSEIAKFNEIGELSLKSGIDIWFNLQLVPEISSELANYQKAIFLDAHTAEIPEDYLEIPVEPKYQNSPFTHHLTPSTCIALADKVYGRMPDAKLITIKGFSFEFSNNLSNKTKKIAQKALMNLIEIINKL